MKRPPSLHLLHQRAGVLAVVSFLVSLVLLGLSLAEIEKRIWPVVAGTQLHAKESYLRGFTQAESIFLLLGLCALGLAMFWLVRCEGR
jgi:hypothetical protein